MFEVSRYMGVETCTESEKQKNLNTLLKKVEKRRIARLKAKGIKIVPTDVGNKTRKVSEQKKIQPTVPVEETLSICDKLRTEPAIKNFNILGIDSVKQTKKIKRVLPDWLLNPTVVPADITKIENLTEIETYQFTGQDIKNKLKDDNITYYFPVQELVIKLICGSQFDRVLGITPRDVLVSAPTGSGKTLAYVLPLMEEIKRKGNHEVRALVIAPTQKLAEQIYETFDHFAQDLSVNITLLVGGSSFEREQKQLVHYSETWGYLSKTEIIVCTPGRLVDHIKRTKGLNLSTVEYLVIDEADRVLSNVQDDWLYHLEKHITDVLAKSRGPSADRSLHYSEDDHKVCCVDNKSRKFHAQRLLFSATLTQDPDKLESLHLFQPILITSADIKDTPLNDSLINVGKFTMPTQLQEKYIVCDAQDKPLLLYKYIEEIGAKRVIIFAKSLVNVHRMTIFLRGLLSELKIKEISSTVSIKQQQDAIKLFKEEKIDILVCTDSLARGIDLPNVQCVVQYDAPTLLRTYIHRVGRTARAGKKGLGITFVETAMKENFLEMLKPAKRLVNIKELKHNPETLECLYDKYKQGLEALKKLTEQEEEKQKKHTQKERVLNENARMMYKRISLTGRKIQNKKAKINKNKNKKKEKTVINDKSQHAGVNDEVNGDSKAK